MRTIPILDQVFNTWYESYPISTEGPREVLWKAFQEGAKFAANDAVLLMLDYAAATAGLPAELRRTEDVYDIVASDLSSHFDYLMEDSNE